MIREVLLELSFDNISILVGETKSYRKMVLGKDVKKVGWQNILRSIT
jgi:hypothetical protein